MEDIPPSYQQSTSPSILDLIAPYLDTLSLHSLTLVSRTYNAAFMPHLWGSPASHFVPLAGPTLPGVPENPQTDGLHDDMVYVALTRFKRVLKKARLSTRCLVHTLYLPPAVSEIYGGPNASWLKEVLDGLPNLQSLCVGGLPFFDHHSLVSVDKYKRLNPDEEFQSYPLRLLLASKEPNATSLGLSAFLPHVSKLVYLDLSYTTPARDVNVLSSLAFLTDLQVLKLRGIGLRDVEVEILAKAVGLNVRLLDVAENLLSDASVRSLLQRCFSHVDGGSTDDLRGSGTGTAFSRNNARTQLESWPVGIPPGPDYLSLDILRSSNFDKNLLKQLTNPLTGRLAFEDIPHSGLTHLYITGNQGVTIEGIRSLLDVGRLHVLDAGDVAGETTIERHVRNSIETGNLRGKIQSINHRQDPSKASSLYNTAESPSEEDAIRLPGAEKLIPALRDKAGKKLTYLRIDHAIVTKQIHTLVKQEPKKSEADSAQGQIAELNAFPGDAQLVEAPGSLHHAIEMPADQVFELDATPIIRSELPGDPIHFALSPPVGDKPVVDEPNVNTPQPIKCDGAYAPEVVGGGESQVYEEGSAKTAPGNHHMPSKSAQSSDKSRIGSISTSHPHEAPLKGPNSMPGPSTWTERQLKIDSLLKARPVQPSSILHPASLPNIRTLVLTHLPSQVSPTSSILTSLQNFISNCAAEEHLALLQAKTNYSLPPGRARVSAEREHARSLFALRTLVLEIVPVLQPSSSSRKWKHTRQRLSISKSSTGDRDSEALWSAAENDFSFFGEDGEEHEECGIYEHEPGKYFPSVSLTDDKFAITPDESSSPGLGTSWSDSTGYNTRHRSDSASMMTSVTGTILKSPLELPLGRNRRSSSNSNDFQRGSLRSPTYPKPDLLVGRSGTINSSSTGVNPQRPPTSNPGPDPNPTSNPHLQSPTPQPQPIDLISTLSQFRKSRKSLYEAELSRRHRLSSSVPPSTQSVSASTPPEIYIPGHWTGEIKVIRTNGTALDAGNPGGHWDGRTTAAGKGRFERNGMVDIYGNYFEKGYLYS